MSVTYFLTDHNGKQIAFFYRIDNERYLTTPELIWQCRDYRQFSGTASSKADFIEQCKRALKDIKKLSDNLPVRKKCKECNITLQGRENESNVCDQCNPITDQR